MTSFSTILDVSYTGGCSSPRLQNHRQDSKLKFLVPELLEYPILSSVTMGFEICTGPVWICYTTKAVHFQSDTQKGNFGVPGNATRKWGAGGLHFPVLLSMFWCQSFFTRGKEWRENVWDKEKNVLDSSFCKHFCSSVRTPRCSPDLHSFSLLTSSHHLHSTRRPEGALVFCEC